MTKENLEKTLDEIRNLRVYYQEFHHKCVSWYITVMGFFIAGSIAAGPPNGNNSNAIGWSIIILTLLLSIAFILCMFHYTKRIEALRPYLDRTEKPTKNWRKKSSVRGISFDGIGSKFFLAIIVLMQSAVIWLGYVKYLC